jgi:hypothetical protein
VISTYLLFFPVQGVIPGFTFPLSTVGRLGTITSPPTQPRFSHRGPRYYVPLRPPLSFPLGSLSLPPGTLLLSFVCVPPFPVARRGAGAARSSPGLLVSRSPFSSGCIFCKETVGSPKFVSCPSMHMPRSSIPVVSLALAISRSALLPSKEMNSVGFLRRCGLSSRTTIVIISGIHVAACALAFPLLRTPPLRDRTSVPLLACWLGFGLAGFSPAGQL